MKKVGLLICLALLTGCTSKLESKIEITDNNKETVIELQDKSFITKYNVLYNGKDIKEALENKEITIEDFISNMQEVSTANDGGSKLYKATDKNKKLYYVAACNTTAGDKDIYLSKDENVIDNCNNTPKEECLNNILGGYIADVENNVTDLDNNKITDKEVDFYFNRVNSKVGMYSIIKTDNEDAIKDYEKYYKTKYKVYTKKELSNNYYVFVANGDKNLDLSDLDTCSK